MPARLVPTSRDPAALHREDATPEQDGAGPLRYGRGFGSHRSRLLTRLTRSPGRRSGAGLRPRSRAARPALEPWPRTPLAGPPHGGVAVLPSRAEALVGELLLELEPLVLLILALRPLVQAATTPWIRVHVRHLPVTRRGGPGFAAAGFEGS